MKWLLRRPTDEVDRGDRSWIHSEIYRKDIKTKTIPIQGVGKLHEHYYGLFVRFKIDNLIKKMKFN